MEQFKNQLLAIHNDEYSDAELLEYFQVIAEKLEIGSIQNIADDLGMSQQNARGSKRVKKIYLRSVLCATSKVQESELPF